MTFLQDARYSVVLLRPKIEIKLATQSAEKWICMGKWPLPSGGVYFHHIVVVRFVPFFFNDHLLKNSSVEYSEKTFFEGAGAKKNLSVPLDETLVLRRIVELPSGVDREVLLVDLRWTDVHDLGGVANLVSSWPFSPWRIWMGFVLSDDDVLVLPIPLPCHVLEEAV